MSLAEAQWWHVFVWGATVWGPVMTYLWLRPNGDMSLAEAQRWHVWDWGPMVTCLWLFEAQWWHVFNYLRPMKTCLWLFEAQWWHALDCLRPSMTRLWLRPSGDTPLTVWGPVWYAFDWIPMVTCLWLLNYCNVSMFYNSYFITVILCAILVFYKYLFYISVIH